MTTLSLAIARVRRAAAILESSIENLNRIVDFEDQLEDALVDATVRAGRRIFKDFRSAPRTAPVGGATRSRSLFSRIVSPILEFLGEEFISGSGTFSRQQLAEAEIRVWWATELGHFAEMRFTPRGEPFFAKITPEEAALLRQGLPPTNLIARLFTELEPVDN